MGAELATLLCLVIAVAFVCTVYSTMERVIGLDREAYKSIKGIYDRQ